MTDVLGTPVRSGADAARAVMVSDLHVPADGDRVVASLAGAIAAAERHGAALFVLGDLFDSYICRSQASVGVWADVAARLAAAASRGLRGVVLVGNRDFLLGREFADAARIELVHGGYRCRIAGADTLLLHGDELCQNDLPYQRAKRWLRRPLTRFVARSLPLALAMRVAERARRKSRAVVASGDQSRFLPSEQAVSGAFALGVDRLVFGHIHRRSEGGFGQGRYHVLPAFDEDGLGLVADEGGWRSARCGAGDVSAGLPLAAPCPWSP